MLHATANKPVAAALATTLLLGACGTVNVSDFGDKTAKLNGAVSDELKHLDVGVAAIDAILASSDKPAGTKPCTNGNASNYKARDVVDGTVEATKALFAQSAAYSTALANLVDAGERGEEGAKKVREGLLKLGKTAEALVPGLPGLAGEALGGTIGAAAETILVRANNLQVNLELREAVVEAQPAIDATSKLIVTLFSYCEPGEGMVSVTVNETTFTGPDYKSPPCKETKGTPSRPAGPYYRFVNAMADAQLQRLEDKFGSNRLGLYRSLRKLEDKVAADMKLAANEIVSLEGDYPACVKNTRNNPGSKNACFDLALVELQAVVDGQTDRLADVWNAYQQEREVVQLWRKARMRNGVAIVAAAKAWAETHRQLGTALNSCRMTLRNCSPFNAGMIAAAAEELNRLLDDG